MKKFFYLFIASILITAAAFLPVCAEGENPVSIPSIGDEFNGFVVTDTYPLHNGDTTVVHMKHEKTGALLLWLASNDINRSFVVGFRTPVWEDTGLPHVFEHASLSGSEKYPSSNLMFEMMYQPYNTYLNAMTYQNHTAFPSASLSEDQLYQFVDYYMNGVYHPLVIGDEHAMMREAYHYELEDPEGEITRTGVVYSEMLGASNIFTAANEHFRKTLFPGSRKTSNTGGDPEFIPQMTHEDIQNFHAAYYHPSNSMVILSGDLDLDRFTALLDGEFLSGFDAKEITIKDSFEIPAGFTEAKFDYPADLGADTENGSVIYYGFPLKGAEFIDEEYLALLSVYMNDNSQPFTRMMEKELPLVTGSVMVTDVNSAPYPTLTFMAMNANESDAETFKRICDDAIAQTLEQEIDPEIVEYLLSSLEFSDEEQADSPTFNFTRSINILQNWADYDGDEFVYRIDDDFMANLRDYITVDSIHETAVKWLGALEDSALVITVPVPGLVEENQAKLDQELADMKASMSGEEISALIEKTQDYHNWIAENEAMSMIDQIKVVDIADLPEEVNTAKAVETVEDGIRIVASEVDSKATSISLLIDAAPMPADMLLDYAFYASRIGTLSTSTMDRSELTKKKAGVAFYTSFSADSISYEQGGFHPYYSVSWDALADTMDESFDVIEDILFTTSFSDYDYIRSTAAQDYQNNQLVGSLYGQIVVSTKAHEILDESVQYSEYLYGKDFYNYLLEISTYSDEQMDELVKRMQAVQDQLLNSNGIILALTGSAENMEHAVTCAKELIAKLDTAEHEPADYSSVYPVYPARIAIPVQDSVQYNLAALDMKELGIENSAKISALTNLVVDNILMPELRFKRSAYGVYCGVDMDHVFYIMSYRDPNLAETYDYYAQVSGILRSSEYTQDDLNGYIS